MQYKRPQGYPNQSAPNPFGGVGNMPPPPGGFGTNAPPNNMASVGPPSSSGPGPMYSPPSNNPIANPPYGAPGPSSSTFSPSSQPFQSSNFPGSSTGSSFVAPAPKATVQFFSLNGGTFTPSSAASLVPGPPPSSAPAGLNAPPVGPPGSSAGPPITGPPPPTSPAAGFGAPPSETSGPGFPQQGPSGNFEATTPGSFGNNANTENLLPFHLPLLSEVDLDLICRKEFMRPTVSKIVNSQSSANASRVPLGMIICPMAGDHGVTNENVPVVDFGTTGIVRCKRCRTYINPFVVWIEGGRRWKCNICGLSNDVPTSYFCHTDEKNRRRDRDQRPELNCCSVEFVAPNDYQIRPPQPPTYLFLIDVSLASIGTGMIPSIVSAAKAVLGEIPGSPRTQIGFITFDSTINFYSLKSTLSGPQMLVVSDLSDIILPLPEDLIVNLQDSRKVVEGFLDSLPSMFPNQPHSSNAPGSTIPPVSQSCTGSALAVAKHLLEATGGKLLLFQGSLPSYGEGALKQRDNVRLLGTDKEHTLLNAEDQFYKNMSLEFNKLQIAADVFLFSPSYTDVATLGVLSRYTGGSLYFYPAFHPPRDSVSFEKDLEHTLTRSTAFEAVMRVRATRGLRVTTFYGNYFIRGSDLLALPNCTSDSVFAIDLAYDEPVLQTQIVTVQAALLYTSSAGERRIRVHNLLVPVTSSVSDMLGCADIDAIMNLLSKQAIDIAVKSGLDNARNRVHQATVDILKSLRVQNSGPGYGAPGAPPGSIPAQQELLVPVALQLLPLYSMALQKSTILRGGTDVRSDERSYYHQRISNADVNATRVFIYPRLFSLHDITQDVGLAAENAEESEEVSTAGPLRIRLPNLLNLSVERLVTNGVYLLENSVELLMWIGRQVDPAFISSLFGVPSLEGVNMSQLRFSENIAESEIGSRIATVVVALQSERTRHMQLHFIREGDTYADAYFSRFMVEDKATFQGGALSYSEYYGLVLRSV